jgi:hypothetical protein
LLVDVDYPLPTPNFPATFARSNNHKSADMTESVATSNNADAAAQRASEQARLRKERREAKLKAGGSARLNKITGVGGRPQTGKNLAQELPW